MKTIKNMNKSSALLEPINFDDITFRSSSAGKLMGKPKGGTPFQIYNKALIEHDEYKVIVDNGGKLTKPQQKKYDELKSKLPELEKRKDDVILSETAISYLLEVYTTKRHGIIREITGKYLDSGKAREDESIKLIAEVDDELYKKCILPRRYNEFIEGECDILYPLNAPEIVIDAKSCWDAYTFEPHATDTEIENEIYEWQGICYCELYGVSKFKLCYTLVDMPDGIIEDELKRILYKFGSDKKDSEEYQIACEEFLSKAKYSHLPANERVISFTFDYNDEKRAKYIKLTKYIKAARIWLNNYSIMRWEQSNKKKWTGKRYDNIPAVETNMVELIEVSSNKIDVNITVKYEASAESVQEGLAQALTNVLNDSKIVEDKPKCPQCESTSLNFKENEDFDCNDCGYDSVVDGNKGIIPNPELENELVPVEDLPEDETTLIENPINKVDESLLEDLPAIENIIITSSFTEPIHQTSEQKLPDVKIQDDVPETITPIKEDISNETNPILIEIENLDSKDACLDYYSEKGIDYWNDNPQHYVALDKKKKSFISPKPVVQSQSESPKQTKIPVAAPENQSAKNIKQNLSAPIVDEPQEGDEEKIAEFKLLYPKFQTVAEFRTFYIANRAIIDRNKKFRDEFELAGQIKAKEIVEETRKKIEEEMKNQ